MNAYDLCTLLINLGVSGMQNRLNVFYGVGQLTDEQYIELTNTLTPKTDSGTTATTGSTD